MQQGTLIRYKLYHLAFWVLVFGVWHYLRYQDYGSTRIGLLVTLVKVVDLALMIYVTNYVWLPRLFYKKKYGLFVLAFIGMILLSSFIKMQVLGRIMHMPSYYDFSGRLKTRIYDNVIPHIFLVTAGAAVQLMLDYTRLQRRMAETAREKAEAELNFLKSQINPHFLFNSLNSVYFLIDKNNHEARTSLHKFSDMLRYQLYEVNGSRIPIERELNYLNDYVDLQKLRKDESYSVKLACGTGLAGFNIEPLLLIPFVENAFKHISHHGAGGNFVKIDLACEDGWLAFQVQNSTDGSHTSDRPGGIGLANVKRRLELLYPGKYHLTIQHDDNTYDVFLKLEV